MKDLGMFMKKSFFLNSPFATSILEKHKYISREFKVTNLNGIHMQLFVIDEKENVT